MNTDEECVKLKRDTILRRVKSVQPSLSYLNQYSKSRLCNIIGLDCGSLGGFKNIKNSCYLDSLFVAMFHFPNNQIIEMILSAPILSKKKKGKELAQDVLDNLKNVYTVVSTGTTAVCTPLRKAMKKYDVYYNQFRKIEMVDWKTDQLEPADFLSFLQRVIRIPECVQVHTKVYATNSLRSNAVRGAAIRESTGYIVPMSFLVDASSDVALKPLIQKHRNSTVFESKDVWTPIPDQEGYLRRVEEVHYLSAPYMIIHVARMGQGYKMKGRIDAPERVKLKNNKTCLYLQSIIVHHGGHQGGHYTCFVRCHDIWYHYDDLTFSGTLEKIGTYADLKAYRNGYAFVNCTDFVYA
jgi:ubiquitin C-terminal hydrolase